MPQINKHIKKHFLLAKTNILSKTDSSKKNIFVIFQYIFKYIYGGFSASFPVYYFVFGIIFLTLVILVLLDVFTSFNLKPEVAASLTAALFSTFMTPLLVGMVTSYQNRRTAVKTRNDKVDIIQADFIRFLVEARFNLIKYSSKEQRVLIFCNEMTAKIIESGSYQAQLQWSILKPEFIKICLNTNSKLTNSQIKDILNFLEAIREQLGYSDSRLRVHIIEDLLN